MNQTWGLHEVHRTQTSTEPTKRYIKSKLLLLNGKFQCPSSKQFARKWLFIYEKLCPDATFNIQRAITTLTLLPLLPNEQLEHQTNNSLFVSIIFFFQIVFLFVCCLSLFVVVIIFGKVSLVKYGMPMRYSTHTHTHTTIKPEQFNIERCCQKEPLQVIICSLS